MKKPKSPAVIFAKKCLDALINPHILFYLLPYMMAILLAGTIAQKYVGNFAATRQFFTSFILWIGHFPLPGGAMVLAILLINLIAYFIVKSQWTLQAMGSTLTHLGVIVLLLGGLVTLANKQEGFIILRHGQTANAFYDYHARDFTVEKNNQIIWRSDFENLSAGQTISLTDLPSSLHIDAAYPNSMIVKGALKKLPAHKEEETNQAGLTFHLTDGSSFTTTEFSQTQPVLKKSDGVYRFSLKRASQELPFTVKLKELTQDVYPGTDTAKSYETQFTVLEKDHDWPAHVSMNNPLRYKGYTFYQASVLTLPNGEQASVLNAVRDTGWLFPYVATGLVSLGLLLNAWMRRHAKK